MRQFAEIVSVDETIEKTVDETVDETVMRCVRG
jgi:hypothetical protein